MLTLYDEFAGWGGSSQGAAAVPGVQLVLAANHAPIAVEVHALNFPDAEHYLGDVQKADITAFPRTDLFWASPSCPPWTDARGVRRDFDRSTQTALLAADGTLDGPIGPDVETAKRRALMEEVPRYLRAMADRGQPVLAGVVENVVQVAQWDQLRRWLREIEHAAPAGYTVRVIALNAMHAQPVHTRRAPQSRDRFFAAYWLNTLGRAPDWDKWLRPRAWCPLCTAWVDAVQVFKNPTAVMGRYGVRHGQYVYRCPRVHGPWRGTHRPGLVHPEALPAATAIDWALPPGPRIGDRVDAQGRPDPLQPATLARIAAWLRRHATHPGQASTLVPTTAHDHAVTAPFLASLRGGGSRQSARGIDQPLLTFSASGTHHALIHPPTLSTSPAQVPPAVVMRNNTSRGARTETALMPYYGNGTARPISQPVGTLTTKDRYAVVATTPAPGQVTAEDCTFRMLAPQEIAAGMAFAPDYRVKGTKREQVAGYGNAVTPPAAEVIVSALVEAITGQDLPR